MKIDFKTIIILMLALFLFKQIFFNSENSTKEITVVVPSKVKEVQETLKDSVFVDTVYIEIDVPGEILPARTKVIVDSLYRAKYKDAVKRNDSLAAENLFLESITIKSYKKTIVDDDDIRIDGEFTTRGELIDYSIRYEIKKDSISYTPKTVIAYPSLSLVYGIGVTVPTNAVNNQPMAIRANAGLQFKNGSIISLGIDTQKNISIGYSKTLRVFK